jgi:hypothetical protein
MGAPLEFFPDFADLTSRELARTRSHNLALHPGQNQLGRLAGYRSREWKISDTILPRWK